MNTKRMARPTHNKLAKAGGKEFNAFNKTREQLPSEAFVKVLKSAPLISPSSKNMPDPRRVSERSKNMPDPRRVSERLKNMPDPRRVSERPPQTRIAHLIKNFTYTPAPTQIGGASAPRRHKLNSTELKEVQEKICKDRQTRREVLFALKKAGKGNKVKDAKWSLSSLIRC